MKKLLLPNGFEFYKEKENWDAIEAACVVNGFERPFIFCNSDYKEIELVYLASLKAFHEKKILPAEDVKIKTMCGADKRFFSDFYYEDDNYKCGYLKCFRGVEYVEWLEKEKIIKIPDNLRISLNPFEEFEWESNTGYLPNEDMSYTDFFYFFEEFDKEIKKCFDYYKTLSCWTLLEAAALISGSDPKDRLHKDGEEILHLLHRAYITNDFEVKRVVEDEEYFSPFEILLWATNSKIKISEKLKYSVRTDGSRKKYYWVEDNENEADLNTDSHPDKNIIHIDIESSNLSKELKIALQAWNAVYNSEGLSNKKIGHKKNIENWLNKNYPSLSGTAIERISTVVNINKKGGAISIE